MTVPTTRPAVPEAVITAARLRRIGRVAEAADVVQSTLSNAPSDAFDLPFRDRVLLILTLVDLQLNLAARDKARELLATESAVAGQILAAVRDRGTPDQVHAASAGFFQLRDRAKQIELLDQPAPSIGSVEWLQGGPESFSDLQGQVVLLEFWAPWCRSCMAMLPFLNELHDNHGAAGLSVLALASYRSAEDCEPAADRELIRGAIAENAVDFAVGIAPDDGLRAQYGAHGIPTYALIDRQGYVRIASSKPDKSALESAILRLLESEA